MHVDKTDKSAHPKTFVVINLGCRVNRVETDSFAAALIHAGALQSDAADAQLAIINTCTVTAEADAKTRKAVHRLLKEAPKAKVLITGCAAAMEADYYAKLDARIEVLADKTKVVSYALAFFGLDTDDCAPPFARAGKGFMARAGIKIQDGCNKSCTYCIVHVARGPSRCKPVENIIEEYKLACNSGIHEVVLTGVNLGSHPQLVSLLECLLELDKKCSIDIATTRIRLSSIEPMDVSDDLISLMAASGGRICPHLHMPLQSGSARILDEMARPYGPQEYQNRIIAIRSALPSVAITTDLIVGFPGETDADFEESMNFCREMHFSKMHIFKYSKRPGTPAAARCDQISALVKQQRAQFMHELAHRMRQENALEQIGTRAWMIVEHIDSDGFLHGTTGEFFQCLVPPPCGLSPSLASLIPLNITGVQEEGLIGELYLT